MQNRELYSTKRPSGRPNLGKTGTIAKRKVDVYLPTEALVEEWRKAAERANSSLSKYVVEIVEKYRNNPAQIAQPTAEERKRAKDLENDLAILQARFDTLNLAFQKQEVVVSMLSESFQKAAAEAIDTETARKIVAVLIAEDGVGVDFDELVERIGFNFNDKMDLQKYRRASEFLRNIGLIEVDGMIAFRWKHGKLKSKPWTGPGSERKLADFERPKHA